MKKILATVLALTMIVGMSITAFAANFTSVPADSETITVNGKYVKTDNNVVTTPVYSIDITWEGDFEFTYTVAADTYTWSPEALDYVKTSTGTEGVWTGNPVDIEITNKSNAGIVVTPEWETADGGAAVTISNEYVTLASAVNAGGEGVNEATTATITVSAPAAPASIAKDGTLGTLTLAITAA